MISNTSPEATDYISAQTEGAVFQCTVDKAQSLLDATNCRILIADGDQLILRASAPSVPNESTHSLPISDRVLRQALTRDKAYVIDDLTDVRSTAANHTRATGPLRYRSLMIVPNDTVGLFLAAGQQPAHFTDDDIGRVEQLLSYAAVALDRIHSQARRNARGERLAEIISTFAHDLRSPLQAATGYLTLAEKTGDDEYFERVTAAHDRMEELLDDMSRLADTGKRVDALQTVDLQQVAEKAWTTVPTGDATLDIKATQTFKADESRLCQLLENLFQNAVDHGPPDVRIRVGTLESGFYVADDGPGIPMEDRDVVFQWQISSDEDHSGLGLSIVKRIVEAHGWEIAIRESALGGTRFEIAV